MSTRANIILTDGYDELIFYRHSDGYPKGTLPTLEKFVQWIKDNRIRDNVSQASGWLILIGADEYNYDLDHLMKTGKRKKKKNVCEPGHDIAVSGWKCGAYEPTSGIHGDIEYLYVVDLKTRTIHIQGQDGYMYDGKYAQDLDFEDKRMLAHMGREY